MTGQISLETLIQGMAGAVVDAQDRIEQHQVANLAGYFDDDQRPRSILLRLPSLAPQASPGDEDFYRAPLLSLVPASPLRIRDVRISFDTNLGEIVEAPAPASGGGNGDEPSEGRPEADRTRTTIHLDPHAGPDGRQFGAVRVEMRVESCEAPEGAARLLNHLAQTQGVVKTVSNG